MSKPDIGLAIVVLGTVTVALLTNALAAAGWMRRLAREVLGRRAPPPSLSSPWTGCCAPSRPPIVVEAAYLRAQARRSAHAAGMRNRYRDRLRDRLRRANA
jgi:hypothetical protein